MRFWKESTAQFNEKERIKTMKQIFDTTDMSQENITTFKREILSYCKENLAKVEAFIPSPFVSKYLLDEVNIGKNFALNKSFNYRRFPSNLLYPMSEVSWVFAWAYPLLASQKSGFLSQILFTAKPLFF